MPSPTYVTFSAGTSGSWRIDRIAAVTGESLPMADRLAVHENSRGQTPTNVRWVLRGVTSNVRYTNHVEASRSLRSSNGSADRRRRALHLFQFARPKTGG